MKRPFNKTSSRLFRALWQILWFFCIPLSLIYLWNRGRKDPAYRDHISERFGLGDKIPAGSIWIHAASLGEVRSAVPLVNAFLALGYSIVFTHTAPAGRREIQRVFPNELENGTIHTRYLPLEQSWAFKLFLKRTRPCFGLVMEVEFWPIMVACAKAEHIPLFLCNGQYPGKSFASDKSWRKNIPSGFSAVMVKSSMMVDRFRSIGCPDIHITGELRFEQPIPPQMLEKGRILKATLKRPVIVFSSVIEGEDDIFIKAIKSHPDVQFIYVPRAPERFEAVYTMLRDAGISVARRSDVIDDTLTCQMDLNNVQVLLGDSLGEMYLYLCLADKVVIGGGYSHKGSHNIIEALQIGKPVAVGPNISTVEYPAIEAIAASVCTHLKTPQDLITYCAANETQNTRPDIRNVFLTQHGGAIEKTLMVLKNRGVI